VREYEAGAKLGELRRRHNISQTTFYKWRAKYGGMAVSLDRLSRDQEHAARLYKHLKFREIEIWTVSEGHIDALEAGLGALMNGLFLEQLADKTRAGLEGKVMDGLSAGGIAYGYRVDHGRNDPSRKGGRGHVRIDKAEAEVVREIFTRYAAGWSLTAIRDEPNRRGVAPPRGGEKRGQGPRTWTVPTLGGHRKRGTGILNNEL
jgi:site-specific DNA recombinase